MSVLGIIGRISRQVPQAATFSMMNRLINSTIPMDAIAAHPKGFNECDPIDARDGTGDYELFYDDRHSVRYIRFHDPSQLQSKIDTSEDKLIKMHLRYPAVHKDTATGRYYMTAYDFSDELLKYCEGDTIAELQSAPIVNLGFKAIDFKFIPKAGGGFIAAYTNGQALIATAPEVTGPWTQHGHVFSTINFQTLQPPHSSNQADEHLFYTEDGKLWLLYHGIPLSHLDNPVKYHVCIVEIDQTTYKAKGRPKQFQDAYSREWHLSSGGTVKTGAYPVYIPEKNELWYGWSQGSEGSPQTGKLGYYIVSANDNNVRGLNFEEKAVNQVQPGKTYDLVSNIEHRTYGSLSNTSGGITASSAGTGLWNFLSVDGLLSFSLSVSFTLSAFPSSGKSTVYRIVSNRKGLDDSQKTDLALTVSTSGALKVEFTIYDGTVIEIDAGTAVVGVQKTVSLTCQFTETPYNFRYTVNGNIYDSLHYMIYAAIYSLLNDKTDILPAGQQMYGTIHSFKIDLL